MQIQQNSVQQHQYTDMEAIFDTESALRSVKATSRAQYQKAWQCFLEFIPNSAEFDCRMPTEEEFIDYFNHLRDEKGRWRIINIEGGEVVRI